MDRVGAFLDHLKIRVPSAAITWILPDVPRLYDQILQVVRTSEGRFNFNDALIALTCGERSISVLASFDQDFDTSGTITRLAGPDQVPPPGQ